MVVVYHLRPALLPGGFVGVDVFFVISGFLITTMLIERPPVGNSDLLSFWARRVRRLLPASLLVLLVCLAGTWAFMEVSGPSRVVLPVTKPFLNLVFRLFLRNLRRYTAKRFA